MAYIRSIRPEGQKYGIFTSSLSLSYSFYDKAVLSRFLLYICRAKFSFYVHML